MQPPPIQVLFETHESVAVVPLVHDEGDPRSRVSVDVNGDHAVTAVLDLTSGRARCGWGTAQQLGIALHPRSTISTIRLGAVLLRDVPVDLAGSGGLVLGVGGWSDAGVAVLPSRGVVEIGDDPDEVLAEVGPPIPLDRVALDRVERDRWWERGAKVRGAPPVALAARVGGVDGLVQLRPAELRSTLGAGVLEDAEVRRDGRLEVWAPVGLGGIEVPGGWFARDESLRDPRAAVFGMVGADLLATLDLAVDPAGGRIAIRPADEPRWSDPPADPLDDPPPDSPDGAADEDDEVMVTAAGDHCEEHLAIGMDRLRRGRADAADEIGRAAELYERWASLDRRVRDEVRAGRAVAGVTRQTCEDAPGLLERVRTPPYRWSEHDLRDTIAQGHADDPVLRGALARRLADRADRVWVPTEDPDPHPLTTALLLGEEIGARALAEDPRWLAGRALYGPDDPSLVGDALVARARDPGDPAAACLFSLIAGEEIPDGREADCVAARGIAAGRAGDADGAAAAGAELAARWPDLLIAEPIAALARTVRQQNPDRPAGSDPAGAPEEPMIPLLASTALAAPAFDQTHAALAQFLKGAVSDDGLVDYALLKTRRSTLDGYLAQVKAVDLTGWTGPQKLALYVNAYNAYTIATMLDNGPPASIRDLDGGKVWDARKFVVAGQELTLNDIEGTKVRPMSDGRVHAVLNCASRGCPPLSPTPLTALTATDEEAQLDAAARRWARTDAFHLDGDHVALSEIFDWYSGDFAKEVKGDIPGVDGKEEAALWFLSRFVDPATKARLTAGGLTPSWQPYDWSNNGVRR